MKAKQSKPALLKRIKADGTNLAELTPAQGLAAMLAFYLEERAAGCEIDEDGDMLLYQWGLCDAGKSSRLFQLDITRQFILPRQDEPYQLALTFHFAPTAKLARIKPGNQWCSSPDQVEAFRKTVLRSPAFRALAKEPPRKVELTFSQC